MLWAAVPETAIYKHCEALATKHNIDSTRDACWPNIDAVAETTAMELASQRQLRSRVLPPVSAHGRRDGFG